MVEWLFSAGLTVAVLGLCFTVIGILDRRGLLPWRDDADDDHRGGLG